MFTYVASKSGCLLKEQPAADDANLNEEPRTKSIARLLVITTHLISHLDSSQLPSKASVCHLPNHVEQRCNETIEIAPPLRMKTYTYQRQDLGGCD